MHMNASPQFDLFSIIPKLIAMKKESRLTLLCDPGGVTRCYVFSLCRSEIISVIIR